MHKIGASLDGKNFEARYSAEKKIVFAFSARIEKAAIIIIARVEENVQQIFFFGRLLEFGTFATWHPTFYRANCYTPHFFFLATFRNEIISDIS